MKQGKDGNEGKNIKIHKPLGFWVSTSNRSKDGPSPSNVSIASLP